MNNNQKRIYNTYLKVSRTQNNKPWRPRNNFDGFEEREEYVYILKLENLFKKFPQIKQEIFFTAPYKIYKDVNHFPLKFFTTQKAINVYSIYQKQIEQQSPDNKEQLDFIKSSIRYIGRFCIDHRIPLKQYIKYKKGLIPQFAIDYKNRNVSIYALTYFKDLSKEMMKMEDDELDLFFGETADQIPRFMIRLAKSDKAGEMVENGFKLLDKLIYEQLGEISEK